MMVGGFVKTNCRSSAAGPELHDVDGVLISPMNINGTAGKDTAQECIEAATTR